VYNPEPVCVHSGSAIPCWNQMRRFKQRAQRTPHLVWGFSATSASESSKGASIPIHVFTSHVVVIVYGKRPACPQRKRQAGQVMFTPAQRTKVCFVNWMYQYTYACTMKYTHNKLMFLRRYCLGLQCRSCTSTSIKSMPGAAMQRQGICRRPTSLSSMPARLSS
jgi:hypothetical protein